MNGKLVIVYGVAASFVASILFWIGTWLVSIKVPDENELGFSYAEYRVGQITTWYLRLTNTAAYAFEVELALPNNKVVAVEFYPKADDAKIWRGTLQKNKTLEVLIVFDNLEVQLSSRVLQSLVKATYLERNEQSGVLEKRTGTLREPGVLPYPRVALIVFWFLLPTLIAGSPILGVWVYRRLKPNHVRINRPPPPRAPS